MVTIPTSDWIKFVSEIRERLATIEADIKSTRECSNTQHEQMSSDFAELKSTITGNDIFSVTSRIRSLEDSRTKMNGVQLGISAAFSIATAGVSWLFSHQNLHIAMGFISEKVTSFLAIIIGRRQ